MQLRDVLPHTLENRIGKARNTQKLISMKMSRREHRILNGFSLSKYGEN